MMSNTIKAPIIRMINAITLTCSGVYGTDGYSWRVTAVAVSERYRSRRVSEVSAAAVVAVRRAWRMMARAGEGV